MFLVCRSGESQNPPMRRTVGRAKDSEAFSALDHLAPPKVVQRGIAAIAPGRKAAPPKLDERAGNRRTEKRSVDTGDIRDGVDFHCGHSLHAGHTTVNNLFADGCVVGVNRLQRNEIQREDFSLQAPERCLVPRGTLTIDDGMDTVRIMALAFEADWKGIEEQYRAGVSSADIAQRFHVTANAIRSRASRLGWSKLTAGIAERAAKRAVQTLVKEEVARIKPGAKQALSSAIQECLDESISAAKEVVTQAKKRASGCEDKDFNSIASGLEKGVNIWRLTHGLDVTASGGQCCAVNLQFVMKGPGDVHAIGRDTPVSRDMERDTGNVTLDV